MINLEDYWEDETPGPDREPTNELRNEVEETITLMELLKVSELKDICRSVSFPVSGRKAVLQDLIRNFLQNALVVGKSDPYRVQAVKFLIERIRKNEPLPVYKDLWNALRKGTPLSAITVRSMEGLPRCSSNHLPLLGSLPLNGGKRLPHLPHLVHHHLQIQMPLLLHHLLLYRQFILKSLHFTKYKG